MNDENQMDMQISVLTETCRDLRTQLASADREIERLKIVNSALDTREEEAQLRAQLATERAAREAAERDVSRLAEWKGAILGRLKLVPLWMGATWAGETGVTESKEGWGFNFEFIGWMEREIEAMTAARDSALARLAEAEKELARTTSLYNESCKERARLSIRLTDHVPVNTKLAGLELAVKGLKSEAIGLRASLLATETDNARLRTVIEASHLLALQVVKRIDEKGCSVGQIRSAVKCIQFDSSAALATPLPTPLLDEVRADTARMRAALEIELWHEENGEAEAQRQGKPRYIERLAIVRAALALLGKAA